MAEVSKAIKSFKFFHSYEKKRWAYHILFWLIHILFFTLLEFTNQGNYLEVFTFQMLTLPLKVIQVYFVLYYLLPRFLQHGKNFQFFIYLILSSLITLIFFHLLNYWFINPIVLSKPISQSFWAYHPSLLWFSLTLGYFIILAVVIKLTRTWQVSEKRAQLILQDKLETELKYLKAQINPHFLFNTLNNLYTLALKKSDKAPRVIDKLAGMLRYISYEANQEKVPLQKEIENLENYISLEKIRHGSRLEVKFDLKGNVENLEIAPLILLPFVENSFKHGISQEIADCWIRINISIVKSELEMKVENTVSNNHNEQANGEGGLGLKNVRRRLDLIYPNKFTLNISQKDTHLAHLNLLLT